MLIAVSQTAWCPVPENRNLNIHHCLNLRLGCVMSFQGLDVIELTNVKLLTREMTSEIYALKGMLLAQIGRSDDANKVFSAAVQMHDTLVKAWALWGDYLEQLFTRDARQISLGTQAITCFLHACRHQNESKSRKYLAKVCMSGGCHVSVARESLQM